MLMLLLITTLSLLFPLAAANNNNEAHRDVEVKDENKEPVPEELFIVFLSLLILFGTGFIVLLIALHIKKKNEPEVVFED